MAIQFQQADTPANLPRVINIIMTLQWRHNGHDGVSNHQPCHCLLNRSFGRISKKPSNLRFTGLCAGNSSVTGESPHKWPVTRKMFPFDEVIMINAAKRVFNVRISNANSQIQIATNTWMSGFQPLACNDVENVNNCCAECFWKNIKIY